MNTNALSAFTKFLTDNGWTLTEHNTLVKYHKSGYEMFVILEGNLSVTKQTLSNAKLLNDASLTNTEAEAIALLDRVERTEDVVYSKLVRNLRGK